MSGPADTYQAIEKAVEEIVAHHRYGNDPTVVRYMVCRAALIGIVGLQGRGRANEIAQRLADEFAAGES